MLIDSHAHLEMKEFDFDREEVIKRARQAGVDFIVTVGTNLALSRKAVELAEKHENITRQSVSIPMMRQKQIRTPTKLLRS